MGLAADPRDINAGPGAEDAAGERARLNVQRPPCDGDVHGSGAPSKLAPVGAAAAAPGVCARAWGSMRRRGDCAAWQSLFLVVLVVQLASVRSNRSSDWLRSTSLGLAPGRSRRAAARTGRRATSWVGLGRAVLAVNTAD